MNTTIEPVGVILKKSWEFFKIHWKKIVHFAVIALIVCLVFYAATFIVNVIIGSKIVASLINTLVNLLVFGVLAFAGAKYIHTLHTGEHTTPWETIKPFLLDYKNIFVTALLATTLRYGGFILIIPAFYFYYGTFFYSFVGGIEGKRGMSALIQSYWYTKDKKATIFGKLLGAYLSLFSIIFIIVLISVILSAIKIPSIIVSIVFIIIGIPLLFSLIAVLQIFTYYLFIQLKNQSSEVVDPAFYKEKKKKFEIFIIIGLVLFALSIASAPFTEKHSPKVGNIDIRLQ